MHTYVRKYVHTSIHRHIDTGIHRYMCISEHILAYVKCICHGLTAWTPLFRFSNSAGFGAAGLFGAAFPMMWWNPTRCFVACRTRQETQLEEVVRGVVTAVKRTNAICGRCEAYTESIVDNWAKNLNPMSFSVEAVVARLGNCGFCHEIRIASM